MGHRWMGWSYHSGSLLAGELRLRGFIPALSQLCGLESHQALQSHAQHE